MAKTYWGLPSQCNFFSFSIPRCRTQFCVYKYCIHQNYVIVGYASWHGSKHIVQELLWNKITMIAEQLCRNLNCSCKNNFLNPSSYGLVYVQINEDICTIRFIMTNHMGNGFLSAFSTKQRKWSNHIGTAWGKSHERDVFFYGRIWRNENKKMCTKRNKLQDIFSFYFKQ